MQKPNLHVSVCVAGAAYSALQFQSAVNYVRGLLLELPFKII